LQNAGADSHIIFYDFVLPVMNQKGAQSSLWGVVFNVGPGVTTRSGGKAESDL
jgi:hypothetical protein